MSLSFEDKKSLCVRAPRRRELMRPDTRIVERPGWFQVITPSAPGTVLNEVVASRVSEGDADRVIDETVAEYAATSHPTKWCVGEWTAPSDFGDRLTARGVHELGRPQDGVFDVARARDAGGRPRRAGHRRESRRVPRRHDARLVIARGADGRRACRASRRPSRHGERSALLRRAYRQRVVGTAWLSLREDYAYLLGTQVFEAARGRGAYRALVAARLAFLRERGIDVAVTHAREATSAPMLEHLGFETLFRSRCYLKAAPTR
ncbi:MAG: GNAT family N-acetyltransferase [Polyangiaceae bacterium]